MDAFRLFIYAVAVSWLGIVACGTSAQEKGGKENPTTTGGASPTGGANPGGIATGGIPGSGGIVTGGIPVAGGVRATGGSARAGGLPATGGAPRTGGDSRRDAGATDTGMATRLDTGHAETSPSDGKTLDAAVKIPCPGTNPAYRCKGVPTDCIPSLCACDEDRGVWGCTADCRADPLPCSDAGTHPIDATTSDGSAPCKTDKDCRLYSQYCDGCLCLPLKAWDPEPVCTTTIVNCLADPCMAKAPRCQDGVCVAGAKSP
jgi:hypothetical protein